MNFRNFFIFILIFFCFDISFGLEYIEFKHGGIVRNESGEVLIEAQDGLVFKARDGQYFVITPDDMIKRSSDDLPFSVYSIREHIERLECEFPRESGYRIMEKERSHFLIVYTTSRGFANWYSQLLERVYYGVKSYWSNRGLKLTEPEFPLVAIIYSNRNDFFKHAEAEGLTLSRNILAYYNKLTNRVVLCDLAGFESIRNGGKKAETLPISQYLRQPEAFVNIATVVHEATHQVSMNNGMQQRFAPYPLWVAEGIALFHEMPDKKDRLGWDPTPKVNEKRLNDLRKYFQKMPIDPIQKMIKDDNLLRDPNTVVDNYAMAWGITYFLAKTKGTQFCKYLNKLAKKDPQADDSKEIRIKEFEECFGNNWEKLYKDCGNFIKKL
ncbi:MAG: DUF1570 domain-containing protein [Planctomycetaceae bacterium]|jgi:hypothetical protein|nr:DUF1570 domain-containing protein [Planctomycetaceae bacterium]